ncbi:MAG TPA: alpha/beta hydrolase [Noviherbaspirillum sp.]|jgi:acetyl esterase/lipase|uniref:alpha/beta hydrolase n=1 Tax=Noviherbaspirillum sp. TaxID=1926288 RepID=UPI002DDDB043|nr:alpha/beta hydrolase [Noviherbaspirillum sp.]HEV2609867.1 alpha/beta hydrolase [Noviherbaspirillum sp.]
MKSDDCSVADVKSQTFSVGSAERPLEARLYTPAAKAVRTRLIVFFPCGSFLSSDLDETDGFARVLAAGTVSKVLAVAYTTAQAEPFPAAAEDAHAVLSWAVRHRAKLDWNGDCLITAGVEAGGNLAAVSALMARDRGGPAVAAQLLIMPMLDAALTSCSMRSADGTSSAGMGAARAADACAAGYRDYLPRAADRVHPYASPLQSSRMKGLPPTLILSADDDPLRDEAEQYGAKLITAGVKTLVRRMPPIAIEQPDARCDCARQESAMREIAGFIAALDCPRGTTPEKP